MIVQGGESHLFFYYNQLARIDFVVEPSYEKFLVLRQHLFSSLGERFSIKAERSVMEESLKTYLSSLADNSYNQTAEKLVQKSLIEGKTFFYYFLEDQKKELNMNFSFRRSRQKDRAVLKLHYSMKSLMSALKEKKRSKNSTLAPKKGIVSEAP